MSGGESSSFSGYREHFVDDFLREFGLEAMREDPEFRRLVAEAAQTLDEDIFQRMMYGGYTTRIPRPEEELTEETAPVEFENLVRQCGPEVVLEALVAAVTEMGDLASVLMIARGHACQLHYQRREVHVDPTSWRDRGDHFRTTGRRRLK